MPLTVGTAGHIDHGKTWLVRALTGKDTDRLPEERSRGISIDLGYAPLDLPDGRRLSLVDVPGHERFVRTMVAGASGIDLFLLVIDAAEGARPQTHEHLAILRLLGVGRGVVAVTKADAVEPDALELALDEARELVPGVAVVAVSAKTGRGLDELRSALADVSVEGERADAPTRLYVDRVFSLHGIGTVATGTLWSGRITSGDVLRAEPGGREVRIRSVQVHDRDVEVAEAGQRVAVALPGIERRELTRGDALVEPDAYDLSYRLDVEVEELAPIPPRVLVHHGTATMLARVVRVDRFAQLRLDAPVVAARGDRLVLRAGTTVGGGLVIDAVPPRHADLTRFERSARGELLIHAPIQATDGSWSFSDAWLEELRSQYERRLDAADPLDPGVPAPTQGWAPAVLPRLGLERRGAKLYRVGAEASLGEREREAADVEARLGLEPVKVEDVALARFLEQQGRLVRAGDGYALSPAAYERARDVLLGELEAAGTITLARFRDLLGVSRKTAQLLLERFDADGVTRRKGDERVLRRGALRR
ncbi:MAG: selenocysteine-specific elongation factor [Gaiellaceae bacterium]|nr:selenocysteine-specific elongation factor [Gaiellaceae bacterium]